MCTPLPNVNICHGKVPKVGEGMVDFVEDIFVGVITVDTIWNIGETGDIYVLLIIAEAMLSKFHRERFNIRQRFKNILSKLCDVLFDLRETLIMCWNRNWRSVTLCAANQKKINF